MLVMIDAVVVAETYARNQVELFLARASKAL